MHFGYESLDHGLVTLVIAKKRPYYSAPKTLLSLWGPLHLVAGHVGDYSKAQISVYVLRYVNASVAYFSLYSFWFVILKAEKTF